MALNPVPERVARRCAFLIGRSDELSRMGMSNNPTLVSYESELIDWDEQIAAGARSVRFILSTIGGIESDIDALFPRYLGRTRAEWGVPSDELLQALNIDFEMCWAALTADEADLTRSEVLAIGAHVWRAIERYSNAVLLAYHEREQELRRSKRLRADATIASFLARSVHRPGSVHSALKSIGFNVKQELVAIATLQSAEEIEQRIIERDPKAVFRISSLPEGTFALWQLTRKSDPAAVLRELDLVWDMPAGTDYIPITLQSLRDALSSSSQNSGPILLADTLMDQVADWLAHSQRYLMNRRLAAYNQQPPARRQRVKEVVSALSASTTTSEAARKMHLHRNTLVQRISLIRSQIGFDLQSPDQLAELRLLLRADSRFSQQDSRKMRR
ncbi:helix-turn-helix domain-containing protein [Brevibacterium sp. RIT 803]|uniref:helix-turn-helix domain-containing protein n=1 Tax=Brevibacterium sp. RIT 803 TaxID=2810210 RepID=UPI00194FC041|nr:helix-turn-helix domain-containing protein [Brevibacterium sp. RIT 803]MBM6588854.1 helix-turn-helix domain-containing protein [Brevibacterium sp. RIT 803]